MALVFPTNPSVNQTHTDGTRSWKWTGARWQSVQASPLAHASTHATGGTDAITPLNIGAVSSDLFDATSGVKVNHYGTLYSLPLTGTRNSRNYYGLQINVDESFEVYWDNSRWVVYHWQPDNADYTFYSTGNTTYPWQANWSATTGVNAIGGTNPGPLPVSVSRAYDIAHRHQITDLIGVQDALDGKEPAISTLPISKGGTGASTAAAALANIGAATVAQGAKADSAIQSTTTGLTGATSLTNIIQITLAGYTAATKNANTLYIIVG
jgi:hypothetical protein